MAGQRHLETLLNCYCREVAAPQGQLRAGPPFGHGDWPIAVRMALQRLGGQVLHVQLPHMRDRLLVVVESASPTGNYRYLSPLFHKAQGKPWALLDWHSLATLLLHELALQQGSPLNTELLDQMQNSVDVARAVLAQPVPVALPPDPQAAYIESEQSLTFGHPFHPTPKARQGFNADDLLRYSPELRTRFALHWFAVREQDVIQRSLQEEACSALVARHAPAVPPGMVAVPVHPWQAGYLRNLPQVRAALNAGRLQYLGEQGEAFYPTSSVRTLYQPGNPYFYKLSLNIRITNCVRKNAWYELESAMAVNRLLRPLLPVLQQQFPALAVMEEPAFMSVDLGLPDERENREVIEGFGMILRRSVDLLRLPGSTPLLAGALFGNHCFGEARVRHILQELANREGRPLIEVATQWFESYLQHLLPPVLQLYFAHGVVFEPHLQNVVLGLKDGWPVQVYLRDFEGVKLLPEHYPGTALSDVSQRARESLWYDAELGWKRIGYCLFVNNLCEVIAQMAALHLGLQPRLWRAVRHQLLDYQARFGTPASEPRINALLCGEPFPAKTNLLNRFWQRADRASAYLSVSNPLATFGVEDRWN